MLDRDHIAWVPGVDQLRAAARREVPVLTQPAAAATRSPCRHRGRSSDLGDRTVVVAQTTRQVRRARSGTGRHLTTAASRRRSAGPELHQARADHLLWRGLVPDRARLRVQEVPRPGPGRAVRRCAGNDRGRPGASFTRGVRVDRRDGAGGSVDRPGARRPSANRRAGRGQGATTGRRPAGAHGPEDDGLDRAAPRRAHSRRRAGQPAGPGRVVR